MKAFKGKPIEILIAVLFAAVFAITAFILYNSGRSPEESASYSDSVQQAIVQPIVGEKEAEIGIARLKHLVRKAGHLIEYGMLSLFATLLVLAANKKTARFFGGTAAFYVLLVASLDELIQGYVGRRSLVSDIFIDLAGAVAGACVAACLCAFVVLVKKKIKR